MAVRLSALRACRHLPPGKFLVLISVKGWVDPRTIVRLEGLGKLKKKKKKIHLIGTRTRNFPACSIVPQPTTGHFLLSRLVIFLSFRMATHNCNIQLMGNSDSNYEIWFYEIYAVTQVFATAVTACMFKYKTNIHITIIIHECTSKMWRRIWPLLK
jgi:hypothetical protein